MTNRTEDRLRQAIRVYTETIEPIPDTWSGIEERLEASDLHPTGPTGSLAGAVALVTAIVLVVVLVAQLRDGNETTIRGRSEPPPLPELAVIAADSGVSVVSTQAGSPVRTLRVDDDLYDYGGQVSVSADANVYFERWSRTGDCADEARAEIVRVSLTDGPGGQASGMHPIISSDGRHLAYGANSQSGCAGEPNQIFVRDLSSSDATARLVVEGEAHDLYPIGWSADADRLLYRRDPRGGGRVEWFEWERASGRHLKVKLPANAYAVWYLGERGLLAAREGTRSAVEFDPRSGKVRKELFDPPQRIQPFLTSNRSGRHVLFSVADPQDISAPGRELWRWSEGSKPKRIPIPASLEHPSGGAWIPDAPADALLPFEIVTTLGGDLVVADSRDGRDLRMLVHHDPAADAQPFDSVSVTDREIVYISRPGSELCPGGATGVIEQIPLTGEAIAGEAIGPAAGSGRSAVISPDGALLASVDVAIGCIRASQVLGVLDLNSRHGRVVASKGSVESDGEIAPVAWSADSDRLLYRTTASGARTAEFFEWSAKAKHIETREIDRMRAPAGASHADYLGDTGLLAVAVSQSKGFRVVAVDPATGDVRRGLLHRARGEVITLDVDRSGRHLLYWTRPQPNATHYELWQKSGKDRPSLLRKEPVTSTPLPLAVWAP